MLFRSPYVSFDSKSIEIRGSKYFVKGIIFFHGISQEKEVEAEIKLIDNRIIIDANFSIQLSDFKIKRPSLLTIKIDNKIRMKEIVCDGTLVATPAGSTAYNLSARGPVLDLESNLLALTPISPFKPRGWRGATINSNSKVSFKNLDPKKRPVSVVADNVEFRHVLNVNIYLNKNKTFRLLYDKKFGLKERNLAEQFKF